MSKFEITLNRIHKGSPFNCSGYLPEVECNDIDNVYYLPEVQEMINKTFGKKFVLQVQEFGKTSFIQYEISKPKAIV